MRNAIRGSEDPYPARGEFRAWGIRTLEKGGSALAEQQQRSCGSFVNFRCLVLDSWHDRIHNLVLSEQLLFVRKAEKKC